jgi:hypothetical protein
MKFKEFICIFVLPIILCVSCLHSRGNIQAVAKVAGIKIFSGSAIVKITGQANENLYPVSIFDSSIQNEKYYDNPAIGKGTITKNETLNMIAGDEYKFSILPSEVVIINITSLDDNDVEVIVRQHGQEKKYTIQGTNKLGFSIAIQNRQ